MSITPNGLATLLRAAAERSNRADIVSQSRVTDTGHVVFDVQDNEGGILRVTINQYKEPIR